MSSTATSNSVADVHKFIDKLEADELGDGEDQIRKVRRGLDMIANCNLDKEEAISLAHDLCGVGLSHSAVVALAVGNELRRAYDRNGRTNVAEPIAGGI